MKIGNNDLDFIDEEYETLDNPSDSAENSIDDELDIPSGDSYDDEPTEDFVDSLLRSRGIEDKSRIKFENDEGYEEEVDWNSLSNTEKMNIINSGSEDPDTALDDSEIQLINAIRNSNMTPSEYIQYIEQSGVNRYVQNSQPQEYSFSTDQYSDDELFVMDFIARMGDVTDDEALDALEKAKSNETLYEKQVNAIRREYQEQENRLYQQSMLEQEQMAQAQYDQFANSVVDQINDLTELSGYDLNLEQDDMQQLYEFIVGTDAAGNNHFAKALADPKVLVRTAYLALNGQQMINDITDYFRKEITNVRRESYEKGRADALSRRDRTQVVFKQGPNRTNTVDDLDDF